MTNSSHQLFRQITIAAVLLTTTLVSVPVLAEGGSAHHSGQASKHSVLALAHGSKSSLKVASAVAAAPLIVSGGISMAVGSSVHSAGDSIANSAQNASINEHMHGPLVVTDITITADPAPDQALQDHHNTQINKKEVKETHTTSVTTEVSTTTLEKKH